MFRKGLVSSVDMAIRQAEVYFPDWDNKVSAVMPIAAGLPDITAKTVVSVALYNGSIADGIIIGVHGILDSGSDHDHDEDYADVSHNHDVEYSDLNHNHDGSYADDNHNHDGSYSDLSHNHDGSYSSNGHDHDAVYPLIAHNHTLVIPDGAINTNHIADDAVTDDKLDEPRLKNSGGTMSGNINMGANDIANAGNIAMASGTVDGNDIWHDKKYALAAIKLTKSATQLCTAGSGGQSVTFNGVAGNINAKSTMVREGNNIKFLEAGTYLIIGAGQVTAGASANKYYRSFIYFYDDSASAITESVWFGSVIDDYVSNTGLRFSGSMIVHADVDDYAYLGIQSNDGSFTAGSGCRFTAVQIAKG